jgi:hypothetical protein
MQPECERLWLTKLFQLLIRLNKDLQRKILGVLFTLRKTPTDGKNIGLVLAHQRCKRVPVTIPGLYDQFYW